MEISEMTKFQNRLSLTGKKKKKETIKNVVVDPHTSYWPLVGKESESLTRVLNLNLPRIKPDKINVPWRIIEKVSKSERKAVRETYLKQHRSEIKNLKEENLILGVNQVTKLLEADSCSTVLVANVQPRILVKHVIEMAVLRNVPVLVVANLKEVLKNTCGFESTVMAIKKGLDESSSLAKISVMVEEISKNYSPNSNHINATRRNIFGNAIPMKVSNVKKISETENEQHEIEKFHLIRTSAESRVFVPEFNDNKTSFSQMRERIEEEITDNVTTKKVGNKLENAAFKMTSEMKYNMANEAVKKNKAKKLYKSLVVKRLKGKKNKQNQKTESKNKIT